MSSEDSRASRLTTHLLVVAALVILPLAVFGPTVGFDFVDYDDNDYVYANPRVTDGLAAGSIGWAFTTRHASNWHPLTWLSLMADASMFGPGPRGFHLTNVLLHVANVLLWWLALYALTGCRAKSAVVAALFAVHPLNVQSVVWISERKELLGTLFGACCLIAYASYSKHRRATTYILSLVAFACSLLSKQMWVTLPFLLVLLDFWPGGRRPTARSLAEKTPHLFLAVAASLATLAAQESGGTVGAISLGIRAGNAVAGYAVYLRQLVWPSGLACFYPHPGSSLTGLTIGGALLLLVSLTAVALWVARTRPYVAIGWFWFVGTLVPVIGLVQIGAQRTADRYMYLPMIGLLVALVWLVASLAPRAAWRGPVLGAVALACIVALAMVARGQTEHWRNSPAMWQRALAVTENNFLAHNHMGTILGTRGDYAGSIEHLERAVAIRPGYASAHGNLAKALSLAGRATEAEEHFRIALDIDPRMLSAHVNWGLALYRQGRLQEAVSHLQTAAELAPDDPRILSLLTSARQQLNR